MENPIVSGREKPAKFLRINRFFPLRRAHAIVALTLVTAFLPSPGRAQIFVTSPGFPPAAAPFYYGLSIGYSVSSVAIPGFFNMSSNYKVYVGPGLEMTLAEDQSVLEDFDNFGIEFVDVSDVSGQVGVGEIHAYADSFAANFGNTDGTIIFTLIDRITITRSGLPAVNLNITGGNRLLEDLERSAIANADATLDFYMWPGQSPVPPKDERFVVIYHFQNFRDELNVDHVSRQPEELTHDLSVGETWWMATRLEVRASAFVGNLGPAQAEGTANYLHTVRLRIDADPRTPDFSYTTSSGIDYHTGAVNLGQVFSRLVHDMAGPFDLDVTNLGAIECHRGTGPSFDGYTLVFDFTDNVTSCGSASVGTVTAGPNANQCSVALNVASGNYATVQLTGVTDVNGTAKNFSGTMGVLVGDTNGDGFVDAVDVSQTKSQSGNAVSESNFREDVNGDGFIDAIDVALVKSLSGTVLSAPASSPSAKPARHPRGARGDKLLRR